MKRTLTLTRESLTELGAVDLSAVHGGQAVSGATCPVLDCLSDHHTCDITASNPRCF